MEILHQIHKSQIGNNIFHNNYNFWLKKWGRVESNSFKYHMNFCTGISREISKIFRFTQANFRLACDAIIQGVLE